MQRWEQVLDRQQGMAVRHQLERAGLRRRRLDHLVATGVLVRDRTGLYRDRPRLTRGEHLVSGGTVDPGYLAEVRSQLLRMPGARAGRRTAAVLWGLDMQVEPQLVELDVPRGSSTSRAGCDIRCTRSRSVVLRSPLPGLAPIRVPTVVDTVLACAAELPLSQAVALADSALRRRSCTLDDLREGLSRRAGIGGLAHLRSVLRWCDPRCGSLLESLLRVLLCQAGLTPERTQLVIADGTSGTTQRVDFAWPSARLVVEVDGRRWHDPADARDRDRRRDNACAVTGWRVLRFTWAEVVHDPQFVLECVRAALAV